MDSKLAQPFHEGELRAQALAGGGPAGTGIRDWMPDQHRTFFAQLPFLFASIKDAAGWPLATVLHGAPGFTTSPSDDSLRIAALPDAGDPAREAFKVGAAIGLLGIELPTRRRNRANGTIAHLDGAGFAVHVSESFGNCPKYITVRNPVLRAGQARPASELTSLTPASKNIIEKSDTFFVATAGDVSHRGGPPGFVQVEGDSLLIPDYPGNRYFNTLGNLLLEPRCSLLFIDFASGDALQLQGRAEVLWERAAPGDPMSVRSWRFHPVRGWLRPGAFSVEG